MKKDSEGRDEGVAGSVSLLQNVTLASQPVSSMDWNADKVINFLIQVCSVVFLYNAIATGFLSMVTVMIIYITCISCMCACVQLHYLCVIVCRFLMSDATLQ